MLQSRFPRTLLDSIECRHGIDSAVFEPHEDASVFLVRFQGYRFEVVCPDGGQEGREAVEESFFAEYTDVVAEAAMKRQIRINHRIKMQSHSHLPSRTGNTESTKSQPSRICERLVPEM